MLSQKKVRNLLTEAQEYANKNTGCCKVAVGSVLVATVSGTQFRLFGANRAIPNLCKTNGCHRVELYGEDSKNHRLPSDCRAIHSEVDVISQAAKFGVSTKDSTLLITRYPCEACARAIVAAGISTVYYGREQEVSEETKEILKGTKLVWVKDWTYEDTER